MPDFILGCDGGSFSTSATLAGTVIRCSGSIVNVAPSDLDSNTTSADALIDWMELIFATPDQAQLQAAFMAGCTIPLIAYLSAWAYAKVIKFATRDDDNY